jgi:hypothetical protein
MMIRCCFTKENLTPEIDQEHHRISLGFSNP